ARPRGGPRRVTSPDSPDFPDELSRPIEAGFYDVRDDEDVHALQRAKNGTRGLWRATHLVLHAAVRRAAAGADIETAIEAMDQHSTALHAWRQAEAAYVGARLGFLTARLPSRRSASSSQRA
ncbi:MAG: hypothetical protein U0360_10525, partial [Dehalococcoidia bacterium]